MPRKVVVSSYAYGPTYNDYPACLTRYQWIVEDALKRNDPWRMFNDTRGSAASIDPLCRVCGSRSRIKDLMAHVMEHAEQLKLRKPVEVTKLTQTDADGSIIWEDYEPTEVEQTIHDAIVERVDGLFSDIWKVTTSVASVIVGHVSEREVGMTLCSNCEV